MFADLIAFFEFKICRERINCGHASIVATLHKKCMLSGHNRYVATIDALPYNGELIQLK